VLNRREWDPAASNEIVKLENGFYISSILGFFVNCDKCDLPGGNEKMITVVLFDSLSEMVRHLMTEKPIQLHLVIRPLPL
jgi:hypothetical protein